MTVLCTYCSSDKDDTAESMPAIQRYRSRRIKAVYTAAATLGLDMMILSGKYGLLNADDPLPWYDHLLEAAEIPEHTVLIAEQLREGRIEQMIFFTRSLTSDPNAAPYQECLRQAASRAGVAVIIVEIEV